MKELGRVLNMQLLKHKKLYEIRWLCLGESLEAICHNFEALCLVLEDLTSADEDPIQVGILNQLRQYRVVATLFFLTDVIKATNALSRYFQHRDISFGAVTRNVSLNFYN